MHSDGAPLDNMHARPALASPLALHSREQMFGDSLQPQRISLYTANSSTQHFWLQWEICSRRCWGWGEGGFELVEGTRRSEKEGARKGETLTWLCAALEKNLLRTCVGMLQERRSGAGCLSAAWEKSRWLCSISESRVTSRKWLCLLKALQCPFKSCKQAQI